jgi:hypothetical protein
VVGFNFLVFKLSSTAAAALVAFLLFRLLKDNFGALEAIFGTALLLFSYDFLRFTSYPNGATLTALLVFAAVCLFLYKRFLLSGAFFGLAGLAGLYSLIGFFALLVYSFFKEKNNFKSFFFGFAVVFVSVNLLFLLIFKAKFITQVYAYHLMKPAEGLSKAAVFSRLLKVNALMFFSALLLFLSKKAIKVKVFVPLVVVAAYLAFFVVLKKFFAYFFVIVFPFLAIIGAYASVNLAGRLRLKKKAAVLVFLLLFVPSAAWSLNKFVSYDYQDFEQASEIAGFVRNNSLPAQTIFGDDSSTGLVALLAGRKITENFIDTNNLRFRSGLTDINETLAMLKSSDVKFVLTYDLDVKEGKLLYGMLYLDDFKNFLNESCNVAKEFREEWNSFTKEFIVYDCEQS